MAPVAWLACMPMLAPMLAYLAALAPLLAVACSAQPVVLPVVGSVVPMLSPMAAVAVKDSLSAKTAVHQALQPEVVVLLARLAATAAMAPGKVMAVVAVLPALRLMLAVAATVHFLAAAVVAAALPSTASDPVLAATAPLAMFGSGPGEHDLRNPRQQRTLHQSRGVGQHSRMGTACWLHSGARS